MKEHKIDKRGHYFISNGKKISFRYLERKKIKAQAFIGRKIFAFNLIRNKDKKNWKLENILCPECKNLAFIIYNDESIILDCRICNKKNNYSLNEFMDIQFEISNFRCDDCKSINNFYDANNESYICSNCNKKLCYSCHLRHKKIEHNVIDYKNNFEYCIKDSIVFECYCNKCNCNYCPKEEPIHQKHSKIFIKEKRQKEKIRKEFRQNINEFNDRIRKYKNELKVLKELFDRMMVNMLNNLDNHMKLNDYMYNASENLTNYQKIKNIEGFLYKKFLKDIINFSNLEIKNKFLYLIERFYTKNIPYGQIELSYTPKSNKKIQFFSEQFVEQNKGNCYLIIKDKIFELCQFYEYKKKTTSENFKINLIANRPILDMKNMFFDCDSLKAFVSYNFDTSKVRNMSSMFFKCVSLISVKGIKDISNVTNMNSMFQECGRLTCINNISNWNLSKVKDISSMFYKCSKLTNISEYLFWDTSNVTNMSNLFNGCKELSKLPDISNWNTSNVSDMNHIFKYCQKLKSFPDISKWNLSKLTNMSYMFEGCVSLDELPDISHWDTSNVEDMSGFLNGCESLKQIPDISSWNISKVTNMKEMFYFCKILEEFPSISSWDTSKVNDISFMFYKCFALKNVPDRSKFKSGIKDDDYDTYCNTNGVKRKSTISDYTILNSMSDKEDPISDTIFKQANTDIQTGLTPKLTIKKNK
jgi:surface protein